MYVCAFRNCDKINFSIEDDYINHIISEHKCPDCKELFDCKISVKAHHNLKHQKKRKNEEIDSDQKKIKLESDKNELIKLESDKNELIESSSDLEETEEYEPETNTTIKERLKEIQMIDLPLSIGNIEIVLKPTKFYKKITICSDNGEFYAKLETLNNY